jgi:hypothetical protein
VLPPARGPLDRAPLVADPTPKLPTYISSASAVSKSAMSQSQPTPSRRARQRPAMRASADTEPPERSTTESPLFTGGLPGSPVKLIQPASPCIT